MKKITLLSVLIAFTVIATNAQQKAFERVSAKKTIKKSIAPSAKEEKVFTEDFEFWPLSEMEVIDNGSSTPNVNWHKVAGYGMKGSASAGIEPGDSHDVTDSYLVTKPLTIPGSGEITKMFFNIQGNEFDFWSNTDTTDTIVNIDTIFMYTHIDEMVNINDIFELDSITSIDTLVQVIGFDTTITPTDTILDPFDSIFDFGLVAVFDSITTQDTLKHYIGLDSVFTDVVDTVIIDTIFIVPTATLQVLASVDGGTTWQDTLWQINDSALVVKSGMPYPWARGIWYQPVIDLSVYADSTNLVIGFYYKGTSNYVDIDNLNITRLESNDMGAININPIKTSCHLENEEITATFKNFGKNAMANFKVAYQIVGGTEVVETVTDSVYSYEEYVYTFETKADLSAVDEYLIDVYSKVDGDPDATNDKASQIKVENYIPKTIPYKSNFDTDEDQFGWIAEDGDGDGETWGIETQSASGYQGSYCAQFFGMNEISNDWFFSPCIEMEAGKTYLLELKYKQMYSFAPERLHIYLAADQSYTKLLNPIIETDLFLYAKEYTDTVARFEVPADGAYHIAFGSDQAMIGLNIDNLIITDNTGVDDINIGQVSIYPNPTRGLINIDNVENAAVEVYNVIGELVASIDRANAFNTIDLSVYDQGTYIVRIASDDNIITRKVVLTK